jgi:hypothetical protein
MKVVLQKTTSTYFLFLNVKPVAEHTCPGKEMFFDVMFGLNQWRLCCPYGLL